jgi:hypothetical protein
VPSKAGLIYEALGLVGDKHLCVCLRLGQSVISSLELDGQAVPSPFGWGRIVSGVASSLLRKSVDPRDERLLREERKVPRSTHQRRRASPMDLTLFLNIWVVSESTHAAVESEEVTDIALGGGEQPTRLRV